MSGDEQGHAGEAVEFPMPDAGTSTCLVCGCSRNDNYEQRMNDLVREMRRQLDAMARQNDRLRAQAS